MSAYEVCDKLVEAIKSDKYDVIIINFANPDMVGHTGVIPAAVKAVEAVAEALGDDGRILVRESGTEPVIRVMVEAATEELCDSYTRHVINVIKEKGYEA